VERVPLQSSAEFLSSGAFICSKRTTEFALYERKRIFEWQPSQTYGSPLSPQATFY
jgi:hypothetical protein